MTTFRPISVASVAACALLVLGSCSSDRSAAVTDRGAFTFDNCGEPVTVAGIPQRVVILGADPVNILDLVGALDQVVAKTGDYPAVYFSEAVNTQLAAIPTLAAGKGPTGGVELSQETIIAEEPDLVIGYETETVTRAGLASAGIPLYVIPAFCASGAPGVGEPVGFDDVYAEIEFYGQLFDAPALARDAVAGLRTRVDTATAAAADVSGADRTAACLYVPADGSAVYAYGPASMANPQIEAAGMTNVFADLDERVAEVSVEELIDRDPDVLILLTDDDAIDPREIADSVRNLPGASAITAVADDQIMVQLFSYTDPPNPLSILGLERIIDRFAS